MARSESGRKSKLGPHLPEIPDKLYFRIGEVAKLLQVPAYVLRFWETEFPHLKPNKGGTGQRLYRRRDVETLLEIRRLLYEEGYTIPGARQLLKERLRLPEPDAAPACATPQTTVEVPRARLLAIQAELRELSALLEQPLGAPARPRPVHRGLHLAARKRTHADTPPSLFVLSRNDSGDDPAQ